MYAPEHYTGCTTYLSTGYITELNTGSTTEHNTGCTTEPYKGCTTELNTGCTTQIFIKPLVAPFKTEYFVKIYNSDNTTKGKL